MKTNFSDAIANAFFDLGVNVITGVPGFGASETMSSCREILQMRFQNSYHEEPAYSIAHAAALVGKRSAILIKAHGLTKAGNAFYDSMYTELLAGFVILIFEDHTGLHSDNILEIEPWIKSMGIHYIHAGKENIYQNVSAGYRISEEMKMPVVLLIDSALINETVEYKRIDQKKNFKYERDIFKTVVHPFLSSFQYKMLKAKLEGNQTAFIERPKLPKMPADLPERYKESGEKYITFFDVFTKIRGEIVTGDTSISSSFAYPPYNSIDIVTHIGGSIPLAIGAYLAGNKNVWSLTGDFGFISAGHYGLIEAVQRNIPLKVVIFNNKQAVATGGQPIPKTMIYRLLSGYENNLMQISNPFEPLEIQSILTEANNSDELKIIFVNYK